MFLPVKWFLLNTTGKLYGKVKDTACYTSNLTPTLQMFDDLIELKKGMLAPIKWRALRYWPG